MMKPFLLYCFLLMSLPLFSQGFSLEFVSKTPLEHGQFIGMDKYGNRYTTQDNILYKQTASETYQFSDLQLGQLTSVDLLNPLKILVFYKHMNTVVLLDDNLNEITRINFNDPPNYKTVGFAAMAANHNIWIFNVGTQELELFDYRHKHVVTHTQPVDGTVLQLTGNYNYCWILTQTHIKCYNTYGSFMGSFPADNIIKIDNDKHLMATLNRRQELRIHHTKTHVFYTLNIPEIALENFDLTGENLYLYDGKFLYHYKLNITN